MIRIIVYISFTLIFCIHTGNIQAAHIIGGDLYYECLGEGRYNFTMTVYRDCQSSGAQFDSSPGGLVGTVTVYRGNETTPYIHTINLDPPQISLVDPNTANPCLIIPPNVCVEKGVYNFEINLPVSDQSYHIVYQRCCRNNTITNIVNPGGTGSTYTIELTPQAQEECNSSIQFKSFPPVVICEGEPLQFDHSAYDPDEDTSRTIEYEFCSPYEGGGLDGSSGGSPGDATSPTGVAPNPDTRPPYDNVQFVGGDFTSSTPLGGSPVVSIDPETGLISGTPRGLGQYVVGVCATEYDSSGNVVSVIRRDFQFNVADCDRKVFAEIEADKVENGEFVVNSCGERTVDFINKSYQEEFINSYRWEFDIDGNVESFSTKNPTVTFPDTGQYLGKMYLNEGTSCSDTADILVNIYGTISNSFEYDYDTCVAGPIRLTGMDMTENGSIIDRHWSFENNDSLNGQVVEYEYRTPGDKSIQYIVTDAVGCTALAEEEIPYFPIPNEIIVDPVISGNCVPVDVFFDNKSYPLDDNYLIEWDFGDGGTSNELSPTHSYDLAGNYTVSLHIESPIGCIYDGVLTETIQTIPSPTAGFSYSPEELNQFNKLVNFHDLSVGAAKWFWSFGAEGGSSQQNPSYEFPDTGKYQVTQVVTHQNGCMDTATALLDVVPKVTYFLPNAFTPNNDGRNDEFLGKGDLIGVNNFEMIVLNRWGELIFQTNDPNEGWNGRKHNTGPLLTKDVYVVKVSYVGPRGERYEHKGFATIVL